VNSFEKRLGDILREAESTPPAGSWEYIQSKIPSSGASFSFPYGAIIATAVLLIGGLAVHDGLRIAGEVEYNDSSIVAEEVTIKTENPAHTDDHIAQPVLLETNGKNESPAETVERMENVPEPREEDSETLPASTEAELDERVASTETPETRKLPVKVSAPSLMNESVEEHDDEIETREADLSPEKDPERTELEVNIEGETTCFTPCNLTLRAAGDAEEFYWDAGIFGKAPGSALDIQIDEPAEFTVFLTGKDDSGREKTTSVAVIVKVGSTLFVPNSFTPNGDGFNDSYRVEGTGIETFSMSIVNSKGKVVFSTSFIDQPWEFDASKHPLENEKYTAVIRALGVDGKVYSINEPLTIIP
jgi:gliding motility-associated-like protein